MVNTEVSLKAETRREWLRISQEHRFSPEGTMEMVLESLNELVDYELAVILCDGGDGFLRVCRAKGPLATARLSGFSIALGERPDLAKILEKGLPRLLDTSPGHRDTYAGILDLPEGHSCLAAPLCVGTKPIGLLTLDHRDCGVFSGQLLRFIGAISRLIAVALVQSEAARSLMDRNDALLAERNQLLDRDADAFRELAGSSGAWIQVLDALKLVAATEFPVLLLGETGTGKEEAARAIHRLSDRADAPFVALNCSALPASLAESELFGHEKGSFTGAQALRRGRFELAHGGTLFLDEIGDLPLEIQPKLLRVIQEGRFERVGGESPIAVDVRIVAATHLDLARAVDAGLFREDLFYRLAVFPIRLPPLRERGEDVLLIAELFASRLRARPGWERLAFGAGALELLLRRPWPGNVRELRNAVERAAILARGGTIGADELRAGDWAQGSCERAAAGLNGVSAASIAVPRPADSVDATLLEIQRQAIVAAIEKAKGRIYGPGGAAAALGLKPSTLQGRMKKLGIKRNSANAG